MLLKITDRFFKAIQKKSQQLPRIFLISFDFLINGLIKLILYRPLYFNFPRKKIDYKNKKFNTKKRNEKHKEGI